MPITALFPIDWQQYEHVVLDFGGVLYEIDHQLTSRAFAKLGFPQFEREFRHGAQSRLFDALECGEIDNQDFLLQLCNQCNSGTSIAQVQEAWNALLIRLRPETTGWIQSLEKHFDLLLLSNTNAIHAAHFEQDILRNRGRQFSSAFRQIIYSHRLGKRKPQPETYVHVAKEYGLTPERTLLIDDTKANVEGALEAGWSAVYFDVEAYSLKQFLLGTGYEDFLNG